MFTAYKILFTSPFAALDPDAAAYIAAVETAGATVSGGQKAAINTFFKTGKSDGWYSSIKRMYLPIWASAAPNAVDMITRASGTFNGTVTHSAGYVQGDGSTGYFDAGTGLSSLGLTSSSSLLSALVYAEDSRTDARSMMGVTPAEILEANTLVLSLIPDLQIGGTSARTGIFSAGLTATNFRYLTRRSSTGSVTVATNSTNSTTGYTGNNLFYMGRNVSGSPTRLHNGRFGAFCVGLGITQASEAEFSASLKTLWETCTGLTLP